jgi:hypothetical protein
VRTTRTSGGSGSEGPEHGLDSFARAENFARAVDRGIRTASDSVLNQELNLVAALRRTGTAIGPNPAERDRMRQRIMAEFASVVHDGTSPVLPLSAPSGWRRGIPAQARGRFVVAAAAALCLLMSLSGMSLLLSQEALPGDALYTFKRSAESAELGLTFGEESKALKHLEFASTRVNEIELMAAQADADSSWSTDGDRFLQALADFEEDIIAGTRLLTTAAASGQPGVLAPMRGWIQQQQARLESVRGALPIAASTRLDSTLALLDRVRTRVVALDQQSGCLTTVPGAHDELGAVPARGGCAPPAPNGTSTVEPLPAEHGLPGTEFADGLVPPGLLAPPSTAPVPEAGRQPGDLRLPKPQDGVLPTPGEPGEMPAPTMPGDGSSPPALPLPLPVNIPLLPFLIPSEDPPVE